MTWALIFIGSEPRTAEFHKANQERFRDWPHTMLATSTHDSKRSEDVRARIDALSEMPGLWRLRVRDWRRFNRVHRSKINDKARALPERRILALSNVDRRVAARTVAV